jgi:hypothetical protein
VTEGPVLDDEVPVDAELGSPGPDGGLDRVVESTEFLLPLKGDQVVPLPVRLDEVVPWHRSGRTIGLSLCRGVWLVWPIDASEALAATPARATRGSADGSITSSA